MAQKNVERLQQYMADLPTADEHSKRSQEISFLILLSIYSSSLQQ